MSEQSKIVANTWLLVPSLVGSLMLSLADEVTLNLHRLIGLKVSPTALAADMRTIQFGDTEARGGGGVVAKVTLAAYGEGGLFRD